MTARDGLYSPGSPADASCQPPWLAPAVERDKSLDICDRVARLLIHFGIDARRLAAQHAARPG